MYVTVDDNARIRASRSVLVLALVASPVAHFAPRHHRECAQPGPRWPVPVLLQPRRAKCLLGCARPPLVPYSIRIVTSALSPPECRDPSKRTSWRGHKQAAPIAHGRGILFQRVRMSSQPASARSCHQQLRFQFFSPTAGTQFYLYNPCTLKIQISVFESERAYKL
jgi:hypothetical protein